MKKLTLAVLALLAFTFTVKAQQYVSTEPANRNVILEEFTGRNCGYCPDGHRIANEIMANNPGRVWAINVHAGGYAPTSYPNFITTDGNTIHGGFSISGYPTGVVNRSTSSGQSRSVWASLSNTELNQASECNVAGRVIVNPDTRVASITVEVYYTGNSAYDQNYLTVAMLQDSIMGSQSGASANPAQVVNGTYCHMHVLRDVINQSAWGDPISPTTQGTLITREYEYQIPEVIGSPNGVDVILDHIFFLAWVSERFQGTPSRPILTGCELEKLTGSTEPIYPMIDNVSEQAAVSCSQNKVVEVGISNIGTDNLTSMTVNAEFNGTTQTVHWEGDIAQFEGTKVEFEVVAPFGSNDMNVTITEANGQPYSYSFPYKLVSDEWIDLEIEDETEVLKLIIMQDKWGMQTTWDFIASDGSVIASGGPYATLPGGGTSLHVETVEVPKDECVKFTIYDEGNNGICCNYGDGYYQIKDSHDNLIVDGDGAFGSMASHVISVKGTEAQVSVGGTEVMVTGYNEADFVSTLSYDGYPDEVGFLYRKSTSGDWIPVVGILNEFEMILASVTDLEPDNTYEVKAFAMVNSSPFYGPVTEFDSWTTSVDELGNSLKLFPNPANEVLNVQGVMTRVEVYNTLGQRLHSQVVSGNSAQVSLSGLNNGIYFLRVYNNGEVVTRSFSVNR